MKRSFPREYKNICSYRKFLYLTDKILHTMKNSFILFTVLFSTLLSAHAQNVNDPYRLTVGEYEVYILTEGGGDGNTGILIDAPAEVLEKYAPEGTFPIATHAVLVKGKGTVVLIDTGYGRQLFQHLEKLGVTPEEIERVLLTHMHGDHIGGMFRNGAKAFPNADVILSKREHAYWSEAGNAGALKVLSEYGEKITTVEPSTIGDDTHDGILAMAAYGHTPGHIMFHIQDGGERLLIWGDLTHALAVQMPHPEISVTYDVDPGVARASRLEVLEYVVREGIPVAGMHIPIPGAGTVTQSGTGYVFLPGN